LIIDAGLLIILGKINKLSLLRKISKKITITPEVKREIMIKGNPGFHALEKSLEWIKIKKPKENRDYGLGDGENSSINLARETESVLVMDDIAGVKISRSLDLKVARTCALIIHAFRKKIIKKKEVLKIIDSMVEAGYYMSSSHYADVIKELHK